MTYIEELNLQIEEAWKGIEELGYGAIDLSGLVFAARYRLQYLQNQAINAREQELGVYKRLTREEKELIVNTVRDNNPILSGPMLTETLRHLIGHTYEGVEDVRQDVPEGGGEYDLLVQTLGQIGVLVGRLQDLGGEQPLSQLLPDRVIRKWAK